MTTPGPLYYVKRYNGPTGIEYGPAYVVDDIEVICAQDDHGTKTVYSYPPGHSSADEGWMID